MSRIFIDTGEETIVTGCDGRPQTLYRDSFCRKSAIRQSTVYHMINVRRDDCRSARQPPHEYASICAPINIIGAFAGTLARRSTGAENDEFLGAAGLC